MNENMLNYVKGKLEEGEGVSPAALTRILAAAHPAPMRRWRTPALLAASLTLVAGSWLFVADQRETSRETDLANIIDLLRVADGDTATTASASLADNLLAWQDAPATVSE